MRQRLLSWGGGAVALAAFLVFPLPLSAQTDLAAEPAVSAIPLSEHPFSGQIAAALGGDQRLSDAYRNRGFAPVWTGDDLAPNDAARALVAALGTADAHALPVSRYRPDALAAALDAPWSVGSEVLFSRSFLRYARDISSGALVPSRVDGSIHVEPVRPDPAVLIADIATAASPQAYLASLAPQSDDYTALLARYETFRALEAEAWGPAVSSGRTLRPGDRNSRVGLLRERLVALGDYPADEAVPQRSDAALVAASTGMTFDSGTGEQPQADPWVFDPGLEQAVRAFQARHGLNVDGVVGPATMAALNVTPTERARQVAVNLERVRWLNRDLGRRHIMVNIPGYHMALVEDGMPVFESRVVVGKPRHETPEFSDEMDHMVVNPTWHVPRSIATNEILPRLREDPGYLSRKNMRLVGSEIDPEFIDWQNVTAGTFPGRIKQSPGAGNALGRVKFMFPNRHAIYLHDTPQRHLFSRDMRAYSHGCVRVEKPIEFAHVLLAAQEADPQAAFDRWLSSGRERYVNLDEHLPVHLTYRTAWVDPDGRDQFREDIYRRDRQVMDALEAAGVEIAAN